MSADARHLKIRHGGVQATYRVVLKPYDGRFVATCPDLQGVVTDGATEDEAMENAGYAIRDMLDAQRPTRDGQ